jgi:hypothetical protein
MLDFLGWAPHGAETSKKNGPGASECPLEHTNVVAKATPVKQILARYTLIKPSVQPHRDGRGDQNRLWDDPWRSAPRHRDLLLRGLDVSNFSPLSSRPERIIATQQGESIQLRPLLKPKPGLSGHPPISAEAAFGELLRVARPDSHSVERAVHEEEGNQKERGGQHAGDG